MSKKSRLPQSPRHIMIFDEDWEFLMGAFGPYSERRLGVSRALQEHIHIWIKRMRAREIGIMDETRAEG